MTKKILYLVGILLVIIVGTILFWYYCCNCGTKNRNADTLVDSTTIASIPDEKTENLDTTLSDSLKKWETIRETLNANPLFLHYETNKSKVNLGQNEILKFEKYKDYLMNNPDGELLVTGHCDNIGARSLNIKLGQARADFVKNYLVSKGADEAKIISSSKGFDDPVADNSTPEGRAKNRRAVVLIK